MGGECVYDEEEQVILKYAFPYHTLYEEKVERELAYSYLFSDQKPDSCEMSRRRFFGSLGAAGIQQGIKNGALSGRKGEAEDFCGALCHSFCLRPDETAELFLEAGAAVTKEQIFEQKRKFSKTYIEEERYRRWKELPKNSMKPCGERFRQIRKMHLPKIYRFRFILRIIITAYGNPIISDAPFAHVKFADAVQTQTWD